MQPAMYVLEVPDSSEKSIKKKRVFFENGFFSKFKIIFDDAE